MPVEAKIRMFGNLPDGRQVENVTLRNSRGMTVRVLNYGAVIQALLVPYRWGNNANVELSYPDLTVRVLSFAAHSGCA